MPGKIKMIKKKNLYFTILILSASLLLSLFSSSCSSQKEKEYNVVLIVIDTLRSDHLSAYGYKRNTSPFIKKVSEEGVLFENAFSASSWTSPATASIFTSLYPFQHKVYMGLLAFLTAKQYDTSVKIDRIPEKIETITEVFKKRGYSTFGIADNLNIGKKQGFDQGFDKLLTFEYKGADVVNEKLRGWKKDLMKSKKYFLYLHYMDPHAPYHSRKPWYREQKGRVAISKEAYDSEINYVDRYISEAYKEFGWDRNTLLIITADHGEGLWDHGKMAHGNSLYREEIQVPFIIRFPKGVKPSRITTNVSTIDILPTIRDYMGFSGKTGYSGVSLMKLIKGEAADYKKRFIFSYLFKKIRHKVEYKAVIYKDLHYMSYLSDKEELYNFKMDKFEKLNHILKSLKTAKILKFKFEDFKKRSKKYLRRSENYKLNKEKIEKLKSLGYIQ